MTASAISSGWATAMEGVGRSAIEPRAIRQRRRARERGCRIVRKRYPSTTSRGDPVAECGARAPRRRPKLKTGRRRAGNDTVGEEGPIARHVSEGVTGGEVITDPTPGSALDGARGGGVTRPQ